MLPYLPCKAFHGIRVQQIIVEEMTEIIENGVLKEEQVQFSVNYSKGWGWSFFLLLLTFQ